jgi:hypothetical protein
VEYRPEGVGAVIVLVLIVLVGSYPMLRMMLAGFVLAVQLAFWVLVFIAAGLVELTAWGWDWQQQRRVLRAAQAPVVAPVRAPTRASAPVPAREEWPEPEWLNDFRRGRRLWLRGYLHPAWQGAWNRWVRNLPDRRTW